MKAEWRDIPGFDGYSVSSDGEIQSRRVRSRIMKPWKIGKGYLTVALCRGDGSPQKRLVHRIVLESFIGPGDGLEASHLNGIKSDNRLENLKWETASENNLRKRIHGTDLIGKKNHASKLRETDPLDICILYASGFRMKDIATAFDVCTTNISNIVRGKAWRWLKLPSSRHARAS